MDRKSILKQVGSTKKTMVMHEDIFQHQVQELHRLYKVQIKLMDEMKNESIHNRHCGPSTNSATNHTQFLDHYNPHSQSVRDNPTSTEQSGTSCGKPSKMPKEFELERPRKIGITARNKKLICDESDEEKEIELTLSIGGGGTGKKRIKSHEHHHRSLELGGTDLGHGELDRGEDCTAKNTTMSTSSSNTSRIVDEQNKRPHWL